MDSDSSALKLWRRLQSLAKLFRFVELLTLLILLSWLSTRLPFAVRISGQYFSKTAAILFSPISIFLVGNAIVLTLLAKSGLFTVGVSSSAVDIAVADLYRKLRSDSDDEFDGVEEVIYQDKEVIISDEKNPLTVDNNIIHEEERNAEVLPEKKKNDLSYRRSKSEKFKSDDTKKEKDNLRRSETDICRRSKAEVTAEDDSDCGGEEFRRTIEAFIAKQMRFHREESLAVVIHGQA